MEKEIINLINNCDLLLIGIGEEFDCKKALKNNEFYNNELNNLINKKLEWKIPSLNYKYLKKEIIVNALNNLAETIKDKDYFIVSSSKSGIIYDSSLIKERIVSPCGDFHYLQCINGCEETLLECDYTFDFTNLKCEKCQCELVYCNIYADNYNEANYLSQWSNYMKWLQGTLNKKVLILEIGVNMEYPSIIRWPFEKTAYLNQKANFIRINESLPQLTEELKDKGISINVNGIEWLFNFGKDA